MHSLSGSLGTKHQILDMYWDVIGMQLQVSPAEFTCTKVCCCFCLNRWANSAHTKNSIIASAYSLNWVY